MPRYLGFWLCVLIGLSGCSHVPETSGQTPSIVQETSAIVAVTSAVTGKNVTHKDLQKAAVDIRQDPEARRSAQTVSQVLSGQQHIKYCPLTGKRYSADLTICPEHGEVLKDIEE